MRIRSGILAACAFATALATTSAQAATLYGDSIDVTLSGAIVLEDFGILVGPDVELRGGDESTVFGGFLFPTEFIDIGTETITMAFDTSLGADAMLTFSDLDFGGGIADVVLISSVAEVTQAHLSFTANSITLNLTDWFATGGAGTFELQLRSVPVPAAIWLFGFALGSLGLIRRKR